MNLNLLGYVAALMTTGAFVPQAFKTIRTRNTTGISLGMYMIFTPGVALWLVYGVAIGAWPIIIANAVGFLLAATILALKLRHG